MSGSGLSPPGSQRYVRERERERERGCVSVCAYKHYHKLFAARISEGNITCVAIQTPQSHKIFQSELQFAYVPVAAKACDKEKA